MSEPGADVAEVLAGVLAMHEFRSVHPDPGATFRWTCGCGEYAVGDGVGFLKHRAHVAAALADVVRAERASALRSAVDEIADLRAISLTPDDGGAAWMQGARAFRTAAVDALREAAAAEATAPHEREAGAAGGGA